MITVHVAYKGKMSYKNRGSSSSHTTTSSLRHLNSSNGYKKVVFQYCNKIGHTVKDCYKINGYSYPPKRNNNPSTHHARDPPLFNPSDWIVDSGATHYITMIWITITSHNHIMATITSLLVIDRISPSHTLVQ